MAHCANAICAFWPTLGLAVGIYVSSFIVCVRFNCTCLVSLCLFFSLEFFCSFFLTNNKKHVLCLPKKDTHLFVGFSRMLRRTRFQHVDKPFLVNLNVNIQNQCFNHVTNNRYNKESNRVDIKQVQEDEDNLVKHNKMRMEECYLSEGE